MKCSKCHTLNEPQANFCSACGTDLRKMKVPAWLWIIIILLMLTSGGVSYIAYETYQSLQKAEPSSVATIPMEQEADVQPIENKVSSPEKDQSNPADRVTLIKDIQQKVFTILTTYGHGSGFLYAKGGYVVTNAHVVDGEVDVSVRNSNEQEYAAKVIGISENYDIALLKVPDYAQEAPLPIEKKSRQLVLKSSLLGAHKVLRIQLQQAILLATIVICR